MVKMLQPAVPALWVIICPLTSLLLPLCRNSSLIPHKQMKIHIPTCVHTNKSLILVSGDSAGSLLLPSDFHSRLITTVNYFLAFWEVVFNHHELPPLLSPKQESFSNSKIEINCCMSFMLHCAECGEECFPRGTRSFSVLLTTSDILLVS